MILKIVREPPPRPITETLDISESYCDTVESEMNFFVVLPWPEAWVSVSVLLGVLAVFFWFFGCG